MFNKLELFGAGLSVFLMALALYLIQVESVFFKAGPAGQTTQVINSVKVDQSANVTEARTDAYLKAVDNQGNFNRMVIDDVKIGNGAEVKAGDTVSVHYIGTLQGGEEFDNSNKRGEPFTFEVGAGQVIAGWEQGVVGMKVGGQRVLVIPPSLAYGERGIGPIPGNATLIFSIELLKIE